MRNQVVRHITLILLMCLVQACGGKDGSPSGPGASTKTLTVVMGSGVTSSLPASNVVKTGANVTYSFSVRPGFKGLRVQLDGLDATVSGSVGMSDNHTLSATADSIIELSRTDSIGITKARSILTSSDPAKILAAEFENAWADQTARGTAAARQSLEHVSTFAFDPKTDAAALAAVNAKLAGAVFDLDIGENLVASRPESEGRVQAAGNIPFTVVFVNGINTSPYDVLLAGYDLRGLLATAGIPEYTRQNFKVKTVYNATSSARAGETAFCTIGTVAIGILSGGSPLALIALITQACGHIADLTRALRDIVELIGWVPGTSVEATRVASVVTAERREGRGVILVGHSQGTLIVQAAMKSLLGSSNDFNVSLQKCTGLISLAGPAPNQFGMSHQKNFYVQGSETKDIILNLPTTSGSSGIPTRLSDETDKKAQLWRSLVVLDWFNWTGIVYGLELHGLNGYLTSLPMRPAIQQEVKAQITSIRSECNQQPTNLAVLTQPVATPVAAAIDPPPAVQIRDAEGNRVGNSTATVTVSLSGTPSSLSGTTTVQAINGVATFSDLRVVTPGTYQLTFSSTGLTAVASASFTVSKPACASSSVSIPFALSGDLRSSSCEVIGKTAALYDFALSAQRAVRFRISGNSFAPRFGVTTRDQSAAFYTASGASGGLFLLAGGQYSASVAANSGLLSSFTFEGAFVPEDQTGCETRIILRSPFQVSSQSLRSGDCANGSFLADNFIFGDSRPCSITMRSSAFDAYLEVYDGSGLLASNDDGAGGTDAIVTLSPCYRGNDSNFIFALTARATSFESGSSGPYTIEFRFGLGSAVNARSGMDQVTAVGQLNKDMNEVAPVRPSKHR